MDGTKIRSLISQCVFLQIPANLKLVTNFLALEIVLLITRIYLGLYLIISESTPYAAPPAPNICMDSGILNLKSSLRELQNPIPSVLLPIIFLPFL